MPRLAAIALAGLCALAAPAARAAVGFQHLTMTDPSGGPVEVGVWYPTDAEPHAETIGLTTQTVARDAPIKGDRLPLVLMSHGHGGVYSGHADTAQALAEAGFVVAALTHPGDNYADTSAAVAIWRRPAQLKRLDDWMFSAWQGHDKLDPARVGAFGFSAGGFTVLAAAGGEADLKTVIDHCRQHPQFETCRIMAANSLPKDQQAAAAGQAPLPPVTWVHDPRIRAVVSAAPAIGFAFGKTGLAGVTQPVQLWRGEDDQVLPHPYYAEAVRQDLPAQPETHVVPKAGHYDFLAPCAPGAARTNAEICASEAGFDRPAFHAAFNRDVVAFFKRTLN